MKIATKLIAAHAGLTGAAAVFAHEGHGLAGAHWHATDAGVFVIVLALIGVALWFGGRKQMIPGELITEEGDHTLNPGRRSVTLVVQNTADRPIQVGSHYHFAETNGALGFDRVAAHGMRLNIASGAAVRFEPGQQRTVELVDFAGERKVFGFRGLTQGPL